MTFQTASLRTGEILSEAKSLVGPQYWVLFGITAVGMLISSLVPFGILTGPMLCGIYLSMFAAMRGEAVPFDMLFKGFDHFVDSLVAVLIIVGVMIAVMVPAYVLFFIGGFAMGMAESQGGGGAAPLLFVLATLVIALLVTAIMVFVSLVTVFAFPLIVDRGLQGVPALKTSYRAVMANFGGMLVLVLVLGLMITVAALFCYIPAFFLMPLVFGSLAIAYRRIFGTAAL
jgi:uncharacterized membrane protein